MGLQAKIRSVLKPKRKRGRRKRGNTSTQKIGDLWLQQHHPNLNKSGNPPLCYTCLLKTIRTLIDQAKGPTSPASRCIRKNTRQQETCILLPHSGIWHSEIGYLDKNKSYCRSFITPIRSLQGALYVALLYLKASFAGKGP